MKKKHTKEPTKLSTVLRSIYGPKKQKSMAAVMNAKLKFLLWVAVTSGKKYKSNLDLPTSIKHGYTVLNPYK
jgi:hypothetical protein